MALEAGLAFTHFNGAAGEYHLLEIMGSGAALLDYDGDSYWDIFLVNGATIPEPQEGDPVSRLYRNRGDGTFQDVTAQSGLQLRFYGMGAAAADYDNDGDPDLYVSGYPQGHLLRNNGDGTFSNVSAQARVENRGRWGTSAGFFDYNRDGFLDLFVCNYMSYDPLRERNCSTANQPTYCHPSNYVGDSSTLYRNNGDSVFSDVTAVSGIGALTGKALGVAFSDFNRDGHPDIFVANDTVANFLFMNEGDGTFGEIAFSSGVALDENGYPRAGMGTDFGDYDGDGWLDLIVTNFAEEGNALFRNEGGVFSETTYMAGILDNSYLKVGFGTRFFDYDNDGDLDVFVANGHIDPSVQRVRDYISFRQENLLYENREGRFQERSTQGGSHFRVKDLSRGAAFGDIDNDGDVDIVVTNNGGGVNLLRNEGGNRNNWLTLRLVGTRSNRDAIGAHVKARVGETTYYRQVQRAGSYLSSHDSRIHLGLTHATEVDELEIAWPSGALQEVSHLKANQILSIREGQVEK